ncbi:MAG: hypothetical protein ABL936_09530 [Aestuariivirga sp.]
MKKKLKKAPYKERSDSEKLLAQWNKIQALCRRRDWSAAVIRAATAVEVCLNLAARKVTPNTSLEEKENLDEKLRKANGMLGKFKEILIPTESDVTRKQNLVNLRDQIVDLNDKRNAIVHSGEFCNKRVSRQLIHEAQTVIRSIIAIYAPTSDVVLKDILALRLRTK